MKIEHIALYVNDLEEARNFFLKYLGAASSDGYHNQETNFRSYFLSFDDGARLEIMNNPGMSDLPKDFTRTGYAHIAFSVGSRKMLAMKSSAAPEPQETATMKAASWRSRAIKLRSLFD